MMQAFLTKAIPVLWFFSGEDPQIIKKINSPKNNTIFALLGAFVLLMFAFSSISVFVFVKSLFTDVFLDLVISIFVALVFTNLYLLTLYTITPHLLPATSYIKVEKGGIKVINIDGPINKFKITLSLMIRMGVLVLLGLFIAQPINAILFDVGNDHIGMASKIIILVSSNYESWILNCIICFLFLMPIYFKYLVRTYGDFYQAKQEIERKFLQDDYRSFLKLYTSILTNNIHEYNKRIYKNLENEINKIKECNLQEFKRCKSLIQFETSGEVVFKHENYYDPPFNTKKKSALINYHSEEDFLKKIYNEN